MFIQVYNMTTAFFILEIIPVVLCCFGIKTDNGQHKNSSMEVLLEGRNSNANPRVIGYFKRETPAGFHHAQFLKIYVENLVSARDVIRIGHTCSIGVYQIKKDSMYGYDYHKINRLSANDVKIREALYFVNQQ
jgi:hypothetical protein